MFSVDNKSIVANQGPEVSNSQTETCPTNPEGIVITGEPGQTMGQLSILSKTSVDACQSAIFIVTSSYDYM